MSKKFYSFLFLLASFLCLGTGTAWGETLTVAETPTTTSDCIPLYGYWADTDGTTSQVIYSSDLLGDLAGGTITAMKFYASTASASWSGTWAVTLGTTTSTTLSGIITPNSPKVVYSGTLSIVSNEMTITFSEGFEYSGEENLLVEIALTKKGNCPDGAFYGISATAVGWCNKKYSAQNVLPKATFTYSAAAPETCAKPTAVTVADENITSNSAIITLAGLNNATVEYKLKSATDYTVAQTGVTGTSYELTGLESYTEYDVQVKNVCGGTDGDSKYVKASFRTKCGPKTIPFAAYGFDDIAYSYGQYVIPACWDKVASGNYPYVYNYSYHSSPNCLYFSGGKSSSEQAIIFPEFSASLAGYTLTFYHKESVDASYSWTSYVYGHFEVGYIKNNEFTTISGPLEQLSAYAETPTEVDFTEALPEGAKLAIRYAGGEDSGTGYIDDIAIKVTPSCTKPTVNNATDETFEGATFTWTAGGSETQWQYIVVGSGAAEDWNSPTLVSTNSATLTGYNAATTYDFYVRSYCSSSEQSESVKKSFTTLAVTAPTAPQVTNAGTTTADFSWNAAAGVSGYQYVAALSGQEPDWNNAQNTTSTSVQLTSLLAGNTYVAYVRSYYSNNNCYSAAVASSAFDTQCEAKTIDADHTFTETFDAFHCWTLTDCASSTGWYENNKFRFFYSKYPPQYLISPEFVTDDRQITVEFDYWKYTSGTETFHLGYSTTTKEVSAFTFLEEVTVTNTSALTYSKNLPAGVKYVAIKYTANDQYYLYIDNFTVSEYVAPACATPTTLNNATDITPEGATFTWEGDADNFQYICVAGGTAETDIDWAAATKVAKAVAPAANQAVISGKAAGTYDFYVRSWCSESEQSEALKKSFTTATIPAPTIGTITATNNSANASWTAPTGISYSVQYQWSINGTDWSAATSETSAAITSLEQNTSYTFYVRSFYDASHQSANATKAFKTACDPFTVAVGTPFEQNFNDVTTNAIPDCWNNDEGTTTTASYKWKVVTGGKSGKCAMFNGTDNGLGKTNVFATPLIELNSDADLSFYWKNKKTGAYTVEISVDGAARTPLISSGLTGKDAWTLKEQPLSAYNGHTIQLFFCGTSANDGSANLYLDEFKITPVSCRKPASDPVESGVTGTEATLTWTAGGTNTDYQFALALKDEAPVWEDANVVTALTKSFDDLTPLTWYDFYVRTYCDEFNQSEARKVTFQTECASFVTLPFSENFNSLAANAIPACWDNSEGTSTDYNKWKGYTYGGTQGTNCVRFNSSTNDADATNVLATPTIQLGEGNLLTFWAKNPTGGALKVQIKEEGEAAVDLLTEGLTGLADWTLKYVAIPAAYDNKKVQILFHATSNYGDENAYIYIDDVRVARGEVFADTENNQSRFTTLKTAGETIDVIFNRTLLCNGDYNTFCLPFSLSAAQIAESPIANFKLKAFDYAKIENEELLIAITNASSIEAGVPYFIANQSNEANQTVQLYQDVVITADAPSNKANSDVTFQGVFTPVDLAAQAELDAHTQLFLAAGNSIYWPAQNKTVKGFRAYFEVVVGSGALHIKAGMPARIVEHTDSATGIENTDADTQALKLLENGNVVIIRNGVKYTIQGQKIQ